MSDSSSKVVDAIVAAGKQEELYASMMTIHNSALAGIAHKVTRKLQSVIKSLICVGT